MRRTAVCVAALVLAAALGGCGKGQADRWKDGYYTAVQQEYVNGWREFVTVCISNGEIAMVEYNAKNASGLMKSWDIPYMRRMNSSQGTYPNQYTRTYAAAMLEDQSPENVEAIVGASSSNSSFKKLAAAVLEQAAKGDPSTVVVDTRS